MPPSIGSFYLELRERALGLELWLSKRPEGESYGLQLVSSDWVAGAVVTDWPYYVIYDSELRDRARGLGVPGGGDILVVAPLVA